MSNLSDQLEKKIAETDLTISNLINNLKTKGNQEHRDAFFSLLEQKQNAFKNQINDSTSEFKQKKLTSGYAHLAITMEGFFEFSNRSYIKYNYYNGANYCHVGQISDENSYTLADTVASYLGAISAFGCVLSPWILLIPPTLIASTIITPIALIALAIFFTIFAPSIFYLMAITVPNKNSVKEEEDGLFAAAALLLIPTGSSQNVNSELVPEVQTSSLLLEVS